MGYVDREEWGECIIYGCTNFVSTKCFGLCSHHYRRKLYWDNPEKHRARAKKDQKKIREADPELARRKRKNNDLLTGYGITIEDYEDQFEAQAGRCAICNRHQDELGKPLAVDHCHENGFVRGLLCFGCNSGIGSLRDDVTIMYNAIEYVKNGGVWA